MKVKISWETFWKGAWQVLRAIVVLVLVVAGLVALQVGFAKWIELAQKSTTATMKGPSTGPFSFHVQ